MPCRLQRVPSISSTLQLARRPFASSTDQERLLIILVDSGRIVLRSDWLPFPSLSLTQDTPQAWKWKMKAMQQHVVRCRDIQKPMPGGDRLIGRKIVDAMPFGFFKMDGQNEGVGHTQ